MIALGPLVLGGGSVSCQVQAGRSLLVLQCSRVDDSNVDVVGVRPLKILNVRAEGGVHSRATDFELFTEMCLLDPGG